MKKRSKIAKPIQPPFKAQAYYKKELTKLIDTMESKLFKKFNTIADSTTEEGILSFILGYLEQLPIVSEIALKFVNIINTINEKKYKKGLENIGLTEVIAPDLETLLETSRKNNISLIKSIPIKMHSKLQLKLKEAFENGENVEEIIRQQFNVSRIRAKIIARDQTAKINHALTAQRATANGSIYYQWRTSQDERVRGQHKELDGKKFKFEGIGSPCCGHPSDEINCRCTARAIYKS